MTWKANCRALGVCFIAVLICWLGLAPISEAQAPGPEAGAMLGPVQRIQGAGMIQRAGSPEFHALAEKDPVFLQDLIGTDPNPDTRVWWKGTQAVQADASLGTATALQFIGFSPRTRVNPIRRDGSSGDFTFQKTTSSDNSTVIICDF